MLNELTTKFANLFAPPAVDSQAEIMKTLDKFSLQLRADQIDSIICFEDLIRHYEEDGQKDRAKAYRLQLDRVIELKQHEGSDVYIMRGVEHLALKKYIDMIKVSVDK